MIKVWNKFKQHRQPKTIMETPASPDNLQHQFTWITPPIPLDNAGEADDPRLPRRSNRIEERTRKELTTTRGTIKQVS
jgi:hypothetical protein